MADDIEFKALLDTGDFDAGMAVLTGGLMHIGALAVDAFLAAGKAVGDFAVESFNGALDAEQAMTRVESVIRSTGGAAGLTAKDVQDLADDFTHLAGGSDDTVIAIEEMGLRMGNISKDQMPNFIQTTLDLAAATGIDAVSGARLMAQAYDDPASAMTKLSKQGILFDTELEAQVKGMVESGDKAGAYALVMERVGEATSGAAAAGLDTARGRMELFKNTVSEAGEQVMGAFIGPLSTLFDTIIAPNIPLITEFGNTLATALTTGDFSALIPPGLAETFQPIIDAATNLGSVFMESMPMIIDSVGGMVAFVQEQFAQFGPTIIANISGTLNTIAAFWDAHGAEVMAIVSFAFGLIVTVVGGAITLVSGLVSAAVTYISGVWSAWSALLQGDTQGAFNAILLAVSTAMLTILSTIGSVLEGAANLVGSSMDEIRSTWASNWEAVKTIVAAVWENIITAVSGFIGDVQGHIDAGIQAIQDAFGIDWASVGQGIIDGIIGGISGAIGGLAVEAANAAAAALQAAKDALGISSPSKAFLSIGKNTMGAFGMGISQNTDLVTGAMNDMISSVTGMMNSLPSSVGGVGQSMSTVNNMTNAPQYNLSVNTQDSSQSVIGNFAVMQAMAGA